MDADDALATACPLCGDLCGEHTLASLAACMLEFASALDYGDDDGWWGPSRPVETVTGATMSLVL